MARREKWNMTSLLLAGALRSRRGIVRVGPMPHAVRILRGFAAVVNATANPAAHDMFPSRRRSKSRSVSLTVRSTRILLLPAFLS